MITAAVEQFRNTHCSCDCLVAMAMVVASLVVHLADLCVLYKKWLKNFLLNFTLIHLVTKMYTSALLLVSHGCLHYLN